MSIGTIMTIIIATLIIIIFIGQKQLLGNVDYIRKNMPHYLVPGRETLQEKQSLVAPQGRKITQEVFSILIISQNVYQWTHIT